MAMRSYSLCLCCTLYLFDHHLEIFTCQICLKQLYFANFYQLLSKLRCCQELPRVVCTYERWLVSSRTIWYLILLTTLLIYGYKMCFCRRAMRSSHYWFYYESSVPFALKACPLLGIFPYTGCPKKNGVQLLRLIAEWKLDRIKWLSLILVLWLVHLPFE